MIPTEIQFSDLFYDRLKEVTYSCVRKTLCDNGSTGSQGLSILVVRKCFSETFHGQIVVSLWEGFHTDMSGVADLL